MVKEEQETLPKFQSAFEQYKKLRARLIDLSLAGRDAEALALADGEAREAQSEARKNLRELIDINVRYAELDEKTNEANAASATAKIIGFIAVGVLFALGIGLFIARASSAGRCAACRPPRKSWRWVTSTCTSRWTPRTSWASWPVPCAG